MLRSYKLILLLFSISFIRSTADELRLNGVYMKDALTGAEFVYQRPIVPIVGIVFMAHGCSHSSTDWWPKGSGCADCIGS